MSNFVSRGFQRRRQTPAELAGRVPPGQYVENGFPVLTAGPTPHVEAELWGFRIDGMVGAQQEWTWDEFHALPFETVPCDIHCVTKWSKLDTTWSGISLDVLLGETGVDPKAKFLTAWSDGGYTTNLPLEAITGGKAWVAFSFDGKPLEAEHGGPARLLVPRLYFWKSAKWVRGIELLERDQPGFWEVNGYHNYGDPWKEQRYQGD